MGTPAASRHDVPNVQGPRDPGLDTLRGVAALSVVLFHLWLYATPAPPKHGRGVVDAVWSSGRLGLVLFFVLSGYLLYRPWVRARDGHAPAPAVTAYLRRRAARILPAYYVALAGAVVLLAAAQGTPGVRLPPIDMLPLFLIFAQNLDPATIMKLDPPMWTLVVELMFYLLLPILGAIMLRARRPVLVACGALAAGLMYDAAVAGQGLSQPWTKALPALLPLFAVGMVMAHLKTRVPLTRLTRGLLLLAAAVLVVADAVWHQLGAGTAGLIIRDLPAGLGFALAVVAIRDVRPRGPVARALAAVGAVSFGLYLWHVPILWWLRSRQLLPLHPITALPVVLGPSLLVAHLSWRFVERPMIAVARRRPRHGAKRLTPEPA